MILSSYQTETQTGARWEAVTSCFERCHRWSKNNLPFQFLFSLPYHFFLREVTGHLAESTQISFAYPTTWRTFPHSIKVLLPHVRAEKAKTKTKRNSFPLRSGNWEDIHPALASMPPQFTKHGKRWRARIVELIYGALPNTEENVRIGESPSSDVSGFLADFVQEIRYRLRFHLSHSEIFYVLRILNILVLAFFCIGTMCSRAFWNFLVRNDKSLRKV